MIPTEALRSLRSDWQGLDPAEAKRRIVEYGKNEVQTVKGDAIVLRFLRSFTHFFAVILWLAAGLAFVAEWKDPGAGMLTLGFAIIGVIAVNGTFSFWQEFRAEQAVASLRRLLPHQVRACRAGVVTQIDAAEVVPGDIVLLEEGDDVPADCRLLETFGVRVNNATVTGESMPQARTIEPDDEIDLLHSHNIVLAGTSIISGQGKALVFATGMHTEFGKIAHLTQTAGDIQSPLQKQILHISRVVAVLAVSLGIVFFLIGLRLGIPFWANFIFAIGIIVANVPEGLMPTVTLALAIGSQRMARRNALIRNLPAVETLGSTTVICTDKTGTLTQNAMTAKAIFFGAQLQMLDRDTDILALGTRRSRLFDTARHCHNVKQVVRNGTSQRLGDAMEVALVDLARAAMPHAVEYPRVDEIAFDTNRKRLSTLHRTPTGLMLFTKGAPETVLPLCRYIEIDGNAQLATPAILQEYAAAQITMAESGLRVLAFAHRAVADDYDIAGVEEQMVLAGIVGLEDPPRPEVPAAIQRCREAGIKVIMVTGDHPETAAAIAHEVGMLQDAPLVITGDRLRHLSDIQLQMTLDAPDIIFARVGADQKMRIVAALKRKGEIVAATGDGVNDAPALKHADIGIAMGISGTDVARESADMILLDDNFATIVDAVEEGRAVYANTRKFLTYILTSNIPELIPYLAFVLFRIPLPLTVIQILAIDLGTDMLPALALGAEKPEPHVMRNPPRSPAERLLNWPLLIRAYLFLGAVEAGAAMAAYLFTLHQGGWHYGEMLPASSILYRQATTACLSAVVVMQIANVFLCRSDLHSMFRCGFAGNALIFWGVMAEIVLILCINYTAAGNLIFGTTGIEAAVWRFILPFAAGMILLEELRKYAFRRLAHRDRPRMAVAGAEAHGAG